jgi:hypothetical protein
MGSPVILFKMKKLSTTNAKDERIADIEAE